MKDHFLKLFAYDKFENEAILTGMIATHSPGNTERIMAHLLSAQQVWLNRCKGIASTSPIVLWPEWKTDTFENILGDNHKGWVGYLNGPIDLEQVVAYKNSQGTGYKNTLLDILTHVINHGTHHRAQIGQHLKLAGLEKLPNTDYISFLRPELLRR
jgi:uncharacterized damage-inducible protein DinB